jgi:antitoxin (DNA-binding transcriptional repressor) of toxin-antitoxin stability system
MEKTKQYSLSKAMNDLPCILEEVGRGVPVHLTREDRPVAALLSIEEYYEYLRLKNMHPEPERKLPKRDLGEAIREFRAKFDLEELNLDDVFDNVRDRSIDGRPVEL